MSAYIMSRAHLYTMITPRVFAPSKGRPHPINQGVSPVFFCTYYSTFCCAKSLQICALPPRACVHACALVRARARACARVRFCFRPSRAHLCGRVYAQAQEAVLLVAFCCAKSLRIHAVPRTGIAGWRSLSVLFWVAHERSAPLDCHFLLRVLPSGGSQKVCTVGLAPSSSKLCPRVAHKS